MFQLNFSNSEDEDNFAEHMACESMSNIRKMSEEGTPLLSISENMTPSEAIFVLDDNITASPSNVNIHNNNNNNKTNTNNNTNNILLKKNESNANIMMSRSSVFHLSHTVTIFAIKIFDRKYKMFDLNEVQIFNAKRSENGKNVKILEGQNKHFRHQDELTAFISHSSSKEDEFLTRKGSKTGEVIQKVIFSKKKKKVEKSFITKTDDDDDDNLNDGFSEQSHITCEFPYSFDEILKRRLKSKEISETAVIFTDHKKNPPLLIVRFSNTNEIEVECSLTAEPIFIMTIAIVVHLRHMKSDLLSIPL